MKTISIIFSFILIATFSFGQKQTTVTSDQKNKIILKVTSQPKEGNIHPIDVVLSRYENIYSAKIDPVTGNCEIVADNFVTIETINKDLSKSGYTVEMISSKPMTKEELVNEGIIDNVNNDSQQK